MINSWSDDSRYWEEQARADAEYFAQMEHEKREEELDLIYMGRMLDLEDLQRREQLYIKNNEGLIHRVKNWADYLSFSPTLRERVASLDDYIDLLSVKGDWGDWELPTLNEENKFEETLIYAICEIYREKTGKDWIFSMAYCVDNQRELIDSFYVILSSYGIGRLCEWLEAVEECLTKIKGNWIINVIRYLCWKGKPEGFYASNIEFSKFKRRGKIFATNC